MLSIIVIPLEVNARQPLVIIPICNDNNRHVKPNETRKQQLECIVVVDIAPMFRTHNQIVSQFQMTME
jgi:hypothetical protein